MYINSASSLRDGGKYEISGLKDSVGIFLKIEDAFELLQLWWYDSEIIKIQRKSIVLKHSSKPFAQS